VLAMVKAITAPFYPAAPCAPPRRPRLRGDDAVGRKGQQDKKAR